MLTWARSIGGFSVAGLIAMCSLAGCIRDEATLVQPAELSGRWVRLQQDGTWGDTLTYLADGQMVGSTSHAVAAGARWSVLRSRRAGEAFCTMDSTVRTCQPFRIEGDTLVLWRLANPTYLRRAR